MGIADSSGDNEWYAGQGEKYRSPGPTVTVSAGHCLRWTSTWDTIGPDGFYVVPGNYGLSYGVEASSSSTSSTGMNFTITD
jgi:hypothetical protein